jgi:manganese oxidase
MKLLGTAVILVLALVALVRSASGRARWRWGVASLSAFALAVALSASVGGASPDRAEASGAGLPAGGAMAGMSMTSPSGTGDGYWSSVAGQPFRSTGRTRTYYLGADEVVWNYAPTGRNEITGKPFDGVADTWTKHGPTRIGTRYVKCLYRRYRDAGFSALQPRPAHEGYLGFTGPVLRAEVGDTIKVVFRNGCSIGASVHPHGVFYRKDSEGAPYADGTSGKERYDDAVPRGGRHTYTWLVPERAGPGPGDGSSVMWMYHSHTDEVSDTYAGLQGFMAVTARGMARADGSPRDVEREVFELYSVMNENNSPYLGENIRRFVTTPPAPEDEAFEESNLMHSINGYVFGNEPMPTLRRGERVRWYLMSMGTEVDLHTPHWHGNDVVAAGMRMDVVSLLPASMVVADMVPDNPGTWLFHCHVNDHLTAGMIGRYRVVS